VSEDEISQLVGKWAHSRFDIILSVDDLELVEDAIRWAVDLGHLKQGPDLLSRAEA